MKCENCGNELVGAAIVCRHCNHNNAQGRVSQWRARRTGELQKPSTSTRSLSPLANDTESAGGKSGRLNSKPLEPIKPPVIPFEPKVQINHAAVQTRSSQSSVPVSKTAGHNDDDQGVSEYPPWRAQLKEKVRQVRERSGALAIEAETEPDEVQLDPNPIVESALKRIRWANHPPPITSLPRSTRHGSHAVALAVEPDYDSEPEPVSETKPQTRVDSNPLLPRRPTKPVNQTGASSPLQRQEAAAKVPTRNEVRIELPPATKPPATVPEDKPTTNPFIAPKPTAQKIRTTGEIKRPQTSPKVQPSPGVSQNSTTTAIPPNHPVETQVIGLSPSVSNAAGYVNIGTATRPATRTAPLWVRTLAGACDFELIAMAYLPMFASYAMMNTSLGSESFALMFVLLAVLTFCYQILTLTLADRTSGMAFLQLRLVNIGDHEATISPTQILARAVAATAAFLCPPLNLIVMQSNQHRHSLPDLFSGTTLIERSSLR